MHVITGQKVERRPNGALIAPMSLICAIGLSQFLNTDLEENLFYCRAHMPLFHDMLRSDTTSDLYLSV